MTHRALRLTIDRQALQSNWRWLADRAGVEAGAAVKANGYGLGASEVVATLADAGCRTFFVSTWAEAEALGRLPSACQLVVLHGVGPDDLDTALRSSARPCLNSLEQLSRWRQAAGDKLCDVMIDTGMNRLGLRVDEIGALDGLAIDTIHSHLACADEDSAMNPRQLAAFREVAAMGLAPRHSLANSAGICLGRDYSFDLVRPGLSLYGGMPRVEAAAGIKQVVWPTAQVVQRRTIKAGESCGYGATFVAERDVEAAILNIGYADGYFRGFSSRGKAFVNEQELPVLGRVSMDLIAVSCDSAPDLQEGQWVEIAFNLESAAEQSGMSQYELLTGLGSRYERTWA